MLTLRDRKPTNKVVCGISVYIWLLEQPGNPVSVKDYDRDLNTTMKIVDITSDEHCELLPIMRKFFDGKEEFNENLRGRLAHNFSDFELFKKACKDLGFGGYLTVNDSETWYMIEVGQPKAIASFNNVNGRFKFNIPYTGITGERLRYMAACSLLMTAAYKDAA